MSSNAPVFDPAALTAQSTWLRRLAHHLVHDRALADDAAQDVLVEAIARPPRQEGPERPWLVAVLRNVIRKHLRSARRRLAREEVTPEREAPMTPEELLARHEAQRLLAELVSSLAEPYRTTVLLRYAEDLPPGEIARRHGVPAGTVRWRLKHGLDELRAKLGERHGGEAGWRAALMPLAAGTPRPWWLGPAAAAAAVAAALLVAGRGDPTPHSPARWADQLPRAASAARSPAATGVPAAVAGPGRAPFARTPRFVLSPPAAERASPASSRPPDVLAVDRRHDFTREELLLLASNCEIRNDLPGMKTVNDVPRGWMDVRDLDRLGLATDERAVVWEAMQRFRSEYNDVLRRLYVAVTGDRAGAAAVDAMDYQDENNPRTALALRTMDARHFMDGARIVAEELAGLDPAPTRFDARLVSLAADHYRRQRALTDDFEDRLAAALGRERARAIRRHPDAGRTRRAWCP